jgi:hypothetical protein
MPKDYIGFQGGNRWRRRIAALTMLGLFGFNHVAAIGSIAVVLGGIVSLGSNVSTCNRRWPQ